MKTKLLVKLAHQYFNLYLAVHINERNEQLRWQVLFQDTQKFFEKVNWTSDGS